MSSQDFSIANHTLVKYKGPGGDVVIPEGVTKINCNAFEYRDDITSIVIPEGVKELEWGCFSYKRGLTSVTLPASIKKIGDSAFQYCRDLTHMVIPEGVTAIEDETFRDCTGLQSVILPESVTKIGASAFNGCTSLQSIIIPEGVTEIGRAAFSGCIGLTEITLPEGITKIEEYAFRDCTGLKEIIIPEGVTEIGDCAFSGCTSLTSITLPKDLADTSRYAFSKTPWLENAEGVVVAGKVLLAYQGKDTEVTVPAGVTVIGAGAFWNCGELTKVTIPEGVTEIGFRAFYKCTAIMRVDIPEGVKEIGSYAFDDCPKLRTVTLPMSIEDFDCDDKYVLPEGVFQKPGKKKACFASMLTFPKTRKRMTAKDWAGVWLFQTTKAFSDICKGYMKAPFEPYVEAMTELLLERGKAAHFKRGADFVIDHADKLDTAVIQKLHDAAVTKKAKDAAAQLAALLQEKSGATVSPDDPYAELRQKFSEPVLLKQLRDRKTTEKSFANVKLADGSKAPVFVVLCAVMPYAEQYERPRSIYSYESDYSELKFAPDADAAAALLDRESLLDALEKIAGPKTPGPCWYIPYCRYAGEKRIADLIPNLRDWADWYIYGTAGRQNIIALRGALMLSDTRAAMLLMDKTKQRWSKESLLEDYAKLRRMKADTLRDTVLADFGLDKEGKKVYDLGGNTVTVSLTPELKLGIFDGNAGKEVKSLPKKGADAEKYEAAKADLAELKKNIKKVVKARCDLLFQRFLDGKTWKASEWQRSYAGDNFLLRQVASLLVWSQGQGSFTIKDGAPIDSSEQPYTIGKSPIQLAHPMEMKAEDVTAWQKYFTAHGIKQPFAQVWEPAMQASSIKEDRYSGIQIPAYRFKGQEKHGISFDFDIGCSELDISFSDCDLEYDPCGENGALNRHMLDLKGMVTLGKFTFKTYTRQVNHIAALLDKWTIIGRIMKDDVTIMAQLDGVTLAQVMNYLNLAIDNGKTNVTAELLNYKNEHFPDFDPLAEFTLDDL